MNASCFLLELPFPPSLNTYYRNWNGRMLLSAKGRQYKTDVLAHVLTACKGKPEPMTGRLKVDIQLHFPTRRLCDIDNRPKAILDALEEAGVFENDSQVDVLTVERCEVRKGGTCMVMITEKPSTSWAVPPWPAPRECEVCDYRLNIDGTCPNDVCHYRKDKRADVVDLG